MQRSIQRRRSASPEVDIQPIPLTAESLPRNAAQDVHNPRHNSNVVDHHRLGNQDGVQYTILSHVHQVT